MVHEGLAYLFSYLWPHYSPQIWLSKLSPWIESWLSLSRRWVKFFLLLWLMNQLSHPTCPQKALPQVKQCGRLSYLHSAKSNWRWVIDLSSSFPLRARALPWIVGSLGGALILTSCSPALSSWAKSTSVILQPPGLCCCPDRRPRANPGHSNIFSG